MAWFVLYVPWCLLLVYPLPSRHVETGTLRGGGGGMGVILLLLLLETLKNYEGYCASVELIL